MGKVRDETGLKFPKVKKSKKKKHNCAKVQEAVNRAIRERDEFCKVRDGRHECGGILTASHYHSVGGNSAFRFYPANIHAQCLVHHGIHERKQEPFFYRHWMEKHEAEALEWMEGHWYASIKYTQEVLETILDYAKNGELEELGIYIRTLAEESTG